MTFKEREKILSKDILSIADVQALNNMSYQAAAKLVRNIKRACGDAVNIQGKVATHAYLEFFCKTHDYEKQPRVKKVENFDRPVFRAKNYI